jgi:signal transduction histidine kinase
MRQEKYPFLVIAWWLACGFLGFLSFENNHFWIAAAVWLIGGFILAAMVSRWSRTERRVNRLEHARRKQAEYIALAVHELNTPLAALRGRLDMLLREDMAGLNRRQRSQFNPVLVASDRLDALVSDLLDTARLDAGRFRIRLQSVDLRPLLNECWQEIQPLLKPPARHRLSLTAGSLLTTGDPTRLRQIFRNLLSNAAKYADQGPVSLTLKRESSHYLITIRDQGIGLNQDELKHLGDKFWQSESPNRQPGTGLGLYIVRQLVRNHHGEISFDSAGPGHGLVVTVRLPLI